MAGWAKRENTKEQIDMAGHALIDRHTSASDLDKALVVINNWRACHAFPLNTFQNGLRHKARQVDQKALVAQPALRGGNLLVIEPPGPLGIPGEVANGFPVAPDLLVYAELRYRGTGQALEAAELVLPEVLGATH